MYWRGLLRVLRLYGRQIACEFRARARQKLVSRIKDFSGRYFPTWVAGFRSSTSSSTAWAQMACRVRDRFL